MENFYIEITAEYLQSLAPPIKQRLEQIIMEKSPHDESLSVFLRLCPYCNKFSLSFLPKIRITEMGAPKNCILCGETNPFDKIYLSVEKAGILYGLSAHFYSGDRTEEDLKDGRALQEQGIVVTATGLEIFLRDTYASGMNLKFVKSKHSLFSKFSNESKNDFINIDKTIQRFKSGLNIDLKKMLNKKEIKIVNELFLKRNAIVHNNGFADLIFINQSGLDCKLGDLIPISDRDISDYSEVTAKMVREIEVEFEKIIYPEIHIRIEDF